MKTLRMILAALGFAAILLIGAGGCSGWPELPFKSTPTLTPASVTPTRPIPTATVTPTATPKTSTQGVMLDLWVPEFLSPYAEGEAATSFSAQLAAFEAIHIFQNYQVTTTVKSGTGAGGLYDLLSTASEVAPTVLPDLLIINQHDLLAAAGDGLLPPLEEDLPVYADYYTATLNSVRNTAGTWAFPYLAQADQMVYRDGITDTAPLTWSAVLSGSYGMLLPAASTDGLAGDALLQLYLGSGGRAMDASGQAGLDRTSLERMYGFLFDLQRAGSLDADLLLTLPTADACWGAYQEGIGDLAPVSIGRFWFERSEGALPAWVPAKDGAPGTVIYTWGIAVVTQDPVRREAALSLARWLVSSNNMGNMAREAKLVPTRRTAIRGWGLVSEEFVFIDTLLSAGMAALPPSVDVPVRRGLQAGFVALLQLDVDTPEAAASTALTALRR